MTQGELVWCLTQGKLTERIRALAGTAPSHAVVVGFNQRLVEMNGRCAAYRYRESERNAAIEQVDQLSSLSLDSQAFDIIAAWNVAAPAPPMRQLSAISEADVKVIQQRLFDLRFYFGNVSGIWQDSAKALREFKTKAGLPAEAIWDAKTQAKLFGGK